MTALAPAWRPGVVSIIMPVYNRAGLLSEAVNSALAQTYRPLEVIIVDDGSTDETVAVAAAFATRHPDVVKVIRVTHGRDWRARNLGLAVATGEFIQFLDSDDLIAPEKLATQVSGLRANPDCGISYCYTREYAAGDPLPQRPARRTGVTFDYLFPHLLAGRIWPYPSPLFRRSVIDAAGPCLELAAYPDWELECRMAALGVRLHHCRSFLAETRNFHKREGRKKNRVDPQTMRESAQVHELILGHARRAGVAVAALQPFARRLFVVGRQSASIGLEHEYRRCTELALGCAGPWRRPLIAAYLSVSNWLGWQRVGHVSERIASGMWRCSRAWSRFSGRWQHRGTVALNEVADRPLTEWPRHLATLWLERPSRQLPRQQGR